MRTYNKQVMQSGCTATPRADRIKKIEADMMTITDMQVQLSKAITDLTTASAINQIERTTVDAVLYIRTFLSLSVGYTIMKSTDAATIVTKNGFRATVLKNSRDFISSETKREIVKKSVGESITNFQQILGLKGTELLARKMMDNLGNTSEFALYLDSLASSGTGTIEKLYKINEMLDIEYDKLAEEHWKLTHHGS